MPALPESDLSTSCKVTNATNSSIVITLPVADLEEQSAGSILSYNRDTEMLALSDGNYSIAANDSQTVTLKRNYKTEDGDVEVEKVYNLLVCKPAWLFPVENIGVDQSWNDNNDLFFKDQLVSGANDTAIKQTVSFLQTISAYPDAQLTKDYVTSITTAVDGAGTNTNGEPDIAAAAVDAIGGKSDEFFQHTKNFQQVTLASIIMLRRYYDSLPFAWAEYKNETNYYLYSSDGTKTSFQGILMLNKTGDIDISKENAGYTCSFNPAQNPNDTTKTDVDSSKAIKLNYYKGVFLDDIQADVPRIALKGIFQLKRTFTRVSTDTMVIAVISGSINGIIAIGFDANQATKPDNTTMDWLNSLFNPKTAEGIFNSVNQIMGAIMMLHFAGTLILDVVRWLRTKITGKKPVTLDELKTQLAELRKANREATEANYKKTNQHGDLPLDDVDATRKAGAAKDLLDGQVGKVRVSESIKKINKGLAELETYAGTNADFSRRINEASGELRSIHETLITTDANDLKQKLGDEIMPQMKTLTSGVSKLSTEVSNKVASDMKAKAKESEKNLTDVESTVADEAKAADDQKTEEANPDLEVQPGGVPD